MYELHRLLGALLSSELTATEKLNIIETEYEIPTERKLEEEVSIMCNLSQGVEERGIALGEVIGEKRGIAIGEERGIAIGKERGIAIGEERGIAIGKERGIAIGKEKEVAKTIFKMYEKNYSLEQIADIMDKTVSEVEEIIRRKVAN